jgi:Condensation domain
VLEPSRTTTITVSGAVAAVLDPMWGQKSIWQWHGLVDDDEAYFNNGKWFRVAEQVPGGCRPDVLVDAVAEVLHSQDALRTTLQIDGGELTGQVVHGHGELSIDVYETCQQDAEAVAEEIAKRLSDQPWTLREWPLRAALVVADGSAAYLVMSHNRLVLDVQSMDYLMFDVAKLACGRADDALSRWQGVQETRYEQSAERAADNARALDHWRDALSAGPPSMFDYPLGTPDDVRYVMAQMESQPLARAVRVLRRRWRVTGGALVLAAMAVVLGQYTGHPDVLVQMFAANRTDRRRRRMLGTLISEGLVHIELRDRSFASVAAGTTRSISAANQYAYCDPDAVRAIRAEVGRRSGAYLDLGVYYNDMQSMQDPTDQPELTGAELAALVADGSAVPPPETWPGWDESWQAKVTRKEIRLLLTAQHGRDLPLLLSCDTSYLSRETIRALLCGMELLLVAAARDGDVAAADFASVTRVEPVCRGPSWAWCGTGWVDVAAVRTLWREVTGSAGSTVLVEEVPDRPGDQRLVGYLQSPTEPSWTQLHEQFVAATRDRHDVRAPAWYRWVSTPPDDPDDAPAWRSAPVRSEGPAA